MPLVTALFHTLASASGRNRIVGAVGVCLSLAACGESNEDYGDDGSDYNLYGVPDSFEGLVKDDSGTAPAPKQETGIYLSVSSSYSPFSDKRSQCSCSAMDKISSWLSSTSPKRTKMPLVTALFHTLASASGRNRILSR